MTPFKGSKIFRALSFVESALFFVIKSSKFLKLRSIVFCTPL